MDVSKLDKWAELLLDTGKRNNLINFKDSRSSSVEIVAPDFYTVFKKATSSVAFEVFDPIKYEAENNAALKEKNVKSTSLEKQVDGNLPSDAFSRRYKFCEKYSSKVSRGNKILLYTDGVNALTALKSIKNKSELAIEETGINIAYAVFGFFQWKEKGRDEIYKAPILLCPIVIECENIYSPMFVKPSGDEIILNPTFAFKVQHELGLTLPEYDDEEDVTDYFAKLIKIIEKPGWTISNETKIGIFSFQKINMYRDLKDNGEKIVESINIRKLLGEFTLDEQKNENNQRIDISDLSEQHNVVDADSSQQEAIKMAKEGQSFVLQGPPGTGKSQTITNIIAECIGQGKRVLFVSEKLAALNVVYDKLTKAGLSDFCLQLHSHKANKKDVIAELCRTLRAEKSQLSSKAAGEISAWRTSQEALTKYADELHKKYDVIERSLYEILEEQVIYSDAPDLSYNINDINDKGESYIKNLSSLLEQYVDYLPSIGYNYKNNVWYGYKVSDTSYNGILLVKEQLECLKNLCCLLQTLANDIKIKYGIQIKNIKQASLYCELFRFLKRTRVVSPALMVENNAEIALERAYELKEIALLAENLKNSINADYRDDVYNIDADKCYKKLANKYTSSLKRAFSKEYKKIINEMRLCKRDGKKPKYASALKTLKELSDYADAVKTFEKRENDVKDWFGPAYCGITTQWESFIKELVTFCKFTKYVNFGNFIRITKQAFYNEQSEIVEVFAKFEEIFAQNKEKVDNAILSFVPDCYNVTEEQFTDVIKKCSNCIAKSSKLDNWNGFCELLSKITQLDADDYVDEFIKANIDIKNLVPTYKKLFYNAWIDYIIHIEPIFTRLSRIPHDKVVKLFSEKDELRFEINKAEIKAELSEKRPDLDLVSSGSSIAILLREGEKKRKQKGIRRLLGETTELVQTLKPCFLMSPLSVSTFLLPDIDFDLVIFDEASQIFPQDAIGAIYRAKQLIVVGDSRQMPPSNFFNSVSQSDGYDEYEDSGDDFESILDLCSVTLPRRRLKWHYRSKFEQLIAFSNKNFYEDELITFPSAKKCCEGAGVEYCYVNGVFEHKTRNNACEAQKVVELVFESIQKYPSRSLGVVAFSVAQQELIEKLIAQKRVKSPETEWFFAANKAEPFFVKNLETVQGDERDIIIFSVAYGKDSLGKLSHNFGPLNQAGGERRLNVAVTRAKINVKLVTSMHSYDIDLSKTQSVGAKLLKEYISFAESGGKVNQAEQDAQSIFGEDEKIIRQEVFEFLKANDFQAEVSVGCSSLKIDIAIKSEETGDYVLAVECDGGAYKNAATTRDRDRLRREILEKTGWLYYRVWSVDWVKNKHVEQERLLSAVRNALNNKNRSHYENLNVQNSYMFENQVKREEFRFDEYAEADIDTLVHQYASDFKEFVKNVLQKEAPLYEERLLKRILPYFGREKITSAFLESYSNHMRGYEKYGIVKRNGFLYLADKKQYALRVPALNSEYIRSAKEIAPEELAAGMIQIIGRNITVEKEGLYKTLAKELGYTRITDSTQECFDKALMLVFDKVKVENNVLSLISKEAM